MERDNAEVLTSEERRQHMKYAAVVEPPSDNGWPSWEKVQREYPDLCGEEQEWVLQSLITAAHEERKTRCQRSNQ